MRLTKETIVVLNIECLLDICDNMLNTTKMLYKDNIETGLLNGYKQKQDRMVEHGLLCLLQNSLGYQITNWIPRAETAEEACFAIHVKDYFYSVFMGIPTPIINLTEIMQLNKPYYIKTLVENNNIHIIISEWSNHGITAIKSNRA